MYIKLIGINTVKKRVLFKLMANRLIQEHNVLVPPGLGFGKTHRIQR